MTSAHPAYDVRIFEKECVSLANNGFETYLVQEGKTEDNKGVHVIGLGDKPKNRLARMIKNAYKAYREAIKLDADLYHIHDPELLPYGLLLRICGKKVIFDSHENVLESIKEKIWMPRYIRMFAYYGYKYLQTFILNCFSGVICVTPNMLKRYSNIYILKEVITNYPIYEDDIKSPDFSNKTIVFAGGISKQWSHNLVIDLLDEIDDCQYLLCGTGTKDYLEELKAMQGWHKVNYLGKIPHKHVKDKLSSSYIGLALLQPGNNTDWNVGTLGNTKIFEEMMAGLPVICTNFDLWREFQDVYNCAICVNPSNKNEVLDAIKYLFDNPQIALEMGNNGKNTVKNLFSWQSEEKKLISFYNNILANEKGDY